MVYDEIDIIYAKWFVLQMACAARVVLKRVIKVAYLIIREITSFKYESMSTRNTSVNGK